MGFKRQMQLQEVIKNDKKNAEMTGASLLVYQNGLHDPKEDKNKTALS